MKSLLFVLSFVLFYSNSFAQDLPERSSQCATHEDLRGKTFKVTGVILESVSTVGMKKETAEKIVKSVGVVPFRMMMKEYFGGLADLSTDQKLVSEFIDYADDLEIDAIQLIAQPHQEFLRFNVGYGGGNGGFFVVQKTASGWKKISSTEDGDLKFCDSSVRR